VTGEDEERKALATRRKRNIRLALILGGFALALYIYAFFLDLY
jgi:hypothetical protein